MRKWMLTLKHWLKMNSIVDWRTPRLLFVGRWPDFFWLRSRLGFWFPISEQVCQTSTDGLCLQ